MSTLHLLYQREVPITDKIHIIIPTVREVLENEDAYYGIISSFTAMPVDYMVALDDAGIDFMKINAFELFLLLFKGLQQEDTSLVLGDLDLSKFKYAINDSTGSVLLVDDKNDIKIDSAVHAQIADALRRIHHLEKNRHRAGNEEGRRYMLEKARKKAARNKGRQMDSQIEPLIVAMVNAEQFKYGFGEVLGLSIYQFNESVRHIVKKVEYDNRMHGVYSGTVNIKDLSQEDLNWLTHK